jgi:hypothetical protein
MIAFRVPRVAGRKDHSLASATSFTGFLFLPLALMLARFERDQRVAALGSSRTLVHTLTEGFADGTGARVR